MTLARLISEGGQRAQACHQLRLVTIASQRDFKPQISSWHVRACKNCNHDRRSRARRGLLAALVAINLIVTKAPMPMRVLGCSTFQRTRAAARNGRLATWLAPGK
jgi:hypothetical protein